MGVRTDSLADFELEIRSEEEMIELGKQLSTQLRKGDIVSLQGNLGAGKTTLARGILRGLGFAEEVVSPTFNLVVEYPTDPPLIHVDLYRLTSPQEVLDLGILEPNQSSVCLIEWPERAQSLLPKGSFWIAIEFQRDGRKVKGYQLH